MIVRSRKPLCAGLVALGLAGMMGVAGSASASVPANWVGYADYTQAPGGTAANAETVGPFNEFDFASAGVVLLKPATTAGDYDGYYQSYVSQHLLDGVLAASPKLNNNYELTLAASFQERLSSSNPSEFDLMGGDFNLYFGPGVNRDFAADSGFTDGTSILHGTITAGSGALFIKSNGQGTGYTDLTIHVDAFDHDVFSPDSIASGDGIFTLRLNSASNAGFLNPINSVLGHSYVLANGDQILAADGNLILAVPEPEKWTMLLSGIAMIGLMTYRRRNYS